MYGNKQGFIYNVIMNLFVVVNDELRLGDVMHLRDLVGENTEQEVKSAGNWKIDKGSKQIYFYGGLKPKDLDVLGEVKKCGFYSPIIQGYQWLFSEDLDNMKYILI